MGDRRNANKADLDRFSYQAMSSIVQNNRRGRRSDGSRGGRDAPPGTTGEAASLRHAQLFSMGDKAGGLSADGAASSTLADLRRARDAARARLDKRGYSELGGIPGLYASSTSTSSSKSKSRRTGATYLTTRPSSVSAANRASGSSLAGSASSTSGYRPRTATTRAAYEDLLSFLANTLLPDGTAEDLLGSFAEQALIVLKSDEYINVRRAELAELFSRKDTDDAFLDTYNTLTEFARRISDFDVDLAKEAGAAELEAAEARARVEHVSVIHREDDGEDGGGGNGQGGGDSGDEDMMAADGQGAGGNLGFEVVDASESEDDDDDPLADSMDDDDEEEDDGNVLDGGSDSDPSSRLDRASTTAAAGSRNDTVAATAGGDIVPCRDIDAYWLQRQLSPHFPDATTSSRMAAQVLETLEAGIVSEEDQRRKRSRDPADGDAMDLDDDGDDDDDATAKPSDSLSSSSSSSMSHLAYNTRAVENNLFLLLEVDASASSRQKVALIRTLLHSSNPFRVVYCTRLRQAQTPGDIAAATTNASRTEGGRAVLAEIDSDDKGRDASGWAADRERAAAAESAASGAGALGERVAAEIQQLEQQKKRGQARAETDAAASAASATWQGKLKTVDLSALAFAEGGRYMGAKRVELPEGT